jgi:AcrR family transcriptional regulator
VGDVKSRRTYTSQLRQEQARHTRIRVLEAAQRRFTDGGYAATTVESIAREAGVAVDTVYSIFGTKRELLAQLAYFRAAGNDEPVAVIDQAGPQAVRRETDQRRQLTMFANGVTGIIERIRPVDGVLRSASAVDAGVAELRARIQEERFSSMRTFAGWLAKNGPLRAGISTPDAATIIWTLTSPDVYALFCDARGWSRARYVRWLAESLIATLLPDA